MGCARKSGAILWYEEWSMGHYDNRNPCVGPLPLAQGQMIAWWERALDRVSAWLWTFVFMGFFGRVRPDVCSFGLCFPWRA